MDAALISDFALRLNDGHPPRVWSLLVTIFGDLAQDEGVRIDGKILNELTALIGIKPAATRVALHRLRNEGWISSAKTGRNSQYFLTVAGRRQTVEASPRIYQSTGTREPASLILFDPSQTPKDKKRTEAWAASNVLITTRADQYSEGFVVDLDQYPSLPDWISGKIFEDGIIKQSAILASEFAELLAICQTTRPKDAMTVAAIRILSVHAWRKIVLATPVLPDKYFPQGWAGQECRQHIATLLDLCPKPTFLTTHKG